MSETPKYEVGQQVLYHGEQCVVEEIVLGYQGIPYPQPFYWIRRRDGGKTAAREDELSAETRAAV